MSDPDDPIPAPQSGKRRGALAIFAFVARSLQQVSSLVITLLAARFLLPAEYGVYSLAVVFVTLIQTLTYTGFYHFVITSKEDDRAVLSTSFWMLAGLATGAAALLAMLAHPIAMLFDAPELAPVLLLLAAIQPIAGTSAWFSAVLLRRQSMLTHFGIMFTQNLIALIGGAVLLSVWQSLYALVAFRYLRVLTGAVLYLGFVREWPRFVFDRHLAVRASGFSGKLYGSRFANFLSRYAGDLLLGYFFTTAEAGLYRFGNRIASAAIDIVVQPMLSFALTQFGAANRQDRDMAPILARFAGAIILLAGGVAAVVIVFSEAVIASFFNPAYMAAAVVTYAMAARGVLNLGTLLLFPVFTARDMAGRLFVFNLLVAAATVSVTFISAQFGLAVLAWSQAIVAALASIAAVVTIAWIGGLSIAQTVRNTVLGLGLILVYLVALYGLSNEFSRWFDLNPSWQILLGLLAACAMAIPTLLIGRAMRVFSLQVFSG